MAQQFYVKINDTVHGPLTGQQLQEMAQSGQLSPTDEVRLATSKTWAPAGNIKGLQFVNGMAGEEFHQSARSSPPEPEKRFNTLGVGIPDPPAYPAISFFIGLYYFLGVIVILAGITACRFMSERAGESIFFPPLLILTFFIAAFCFFSAQLLTLAADSARNLHRLTHSNLQIMQLIVNSKK